MYQSTTAHCSTSSLPVIHKIMLNKKKAQIMLTLWSIHAFLLSRMWLSMIWKISCGEGIRPVSNLDHTGTSATNLFHLTIPNNTSHCSNKQLNCFKTLPTHCYTSHVSTLETNTTMTRQKIQKRIQSLLAVTCASNCLILIIFHKDQETELSIQQSITHVLNVHIVSHHI